MVDLHIHTMYSDGDKSLEEVLKLCETKKLKYISITDHHTCKAYEDKAIIENKIFTGKIIIGAEMNAYRKNKRIEFLGYNIKIPKMIDEWFSKYYSKEVLTNRFNRDKRKILEICDKYNLVYSDAILNKNIPITDFFVVHMFYELIKHKENQKIIGEQYTNFNDFWHNELEKPNSKFYMGEDKNPKPDYKEVEKLIHKAGGLLFLAHPFEYNFENTLDFIDELRTEIKLDGIECFHPSSEKENRIDLLVNYARKNHLYISGGSDFHGDKKPNIKIGCGSGNLNIDESYIKEWYKNNQ